MATPITEVIAYTVREDLLERFQANLASAHAVLHSLPGFRSLRTLRAAGLPGKPATFVDITEWDSEEQARAGGKRAMELPQMAIYFELGEEALITFGYYETVHFTALEPR